MFRILLVEAFEVGKNPMTPDWLMQPLGLMMLGGSLRKSGYEDIRIFDSKLYLNPKDELRSLVSTFKPHVVGFRSLSSSADFMHSLVKIIKKESKEIITVAGGPHATTRPVETMQDRNLDYIVFNEGEITFPELLNAIRDGKDPSGVRGIGFRRNGEVVFTETRPYIENLDNLPLPAWDLVDHSLYRGRFFVEINNRINYVQVRPNSMPIFSSRACPYDCIYCHKIFGRTYRAHSPERVLKEIDILYDKFNVRQIDFYDDIFNLNRKRTEEILKGIAERRREGRDIKLSFFSGLRGDVQDPSLIKYFRNAGTFMIPYAVETASPRLQKLIRKNIDLEKLKRIVSITSRMNIITVGFAMLGFPTETREEIETTINFMLSSDFDVIEFFIVSPYFGTELARMIKERHPNIDEKDISDFHFSKVKYTLSQLTPEELSEIYKEAYNKLFADRPRVSRLMSKIIYHRKN